MQELRVGSLLQQGKYRIEKVLGQGGFGITYQAKMRTVVTGDIGTMDVDVNVAIKEFFIKERCVRDELTSHVSIPSEGGQKLVELYRRKFVKEAHNMAAMHHPNIVKVTNVFEENGTVYYVMQFLPGGSLSSYVRSQPSGRLREAEAMHFIRQIGSALHYMHTTAHTCHLDVKPGNVLLDEKGNAVLIDFGLAKNYDNQGNQTSSTPVGVSKGYAPLEQYQQELTTFSPQTDVYSLGATLYFLLTGQVPPEASVVNEEGLASCPDFVSQDLWKIIEKAMQPRRRERYTSMENMLQALKDVSSDADQTEVELGVTPIIDVQPEQEVIVEQTAKTEKKLPLKWIKVALVVFAAICGIFLAVRFQGKSPTDVASTSDNETAIEDAASVGSTEYQGDWIEDFKVLDPNGNLTYTYKGYAIDNVPNGKGTAIYPSNDKEKRKKYEGNFEKGQRHGNGTLTYQNGDSFSGSFNMGHFETGTYKIAEDGSSFTGSYKNDTPYDGVWLDRNGKTIAHVNKGNTN